MISLVEASEANDPCETDRNLLRIFFFFFLRYMNWDWQASQFWVQEAMHFYLDYVFQPVPPNQAQPKLYHEQQLHNTSRYPNRP